MLELNLNLNIVLSGKILYAITPTPRNEKHAYLHLVKADSDSAYPLSGDKVNCEFAEISFIQTRK